VGVYFPVRVQCNFPAAVAEHSRTAAVRRRRRRRGKNNAII